MKKNILIFVSGCLCTMIITVGASIVFKASEISYSNLNSEVTNVQDAIDDLNDINVKGKELIINTLSDNGVEISNDASYEEISQKIKDFKSASGIPKKTIEITGSHWYGKDGYTQTRYTTALNIDVSVENGQIVFNANSGSTGRFGAESGYAWGASQIDYVVK